ncbi:MAG TPA: hypothetical protein VNC84_05365 [Gammaproteobacteria bacterium]|jgi:hypothetical protein|nr:hypothetical protein [Gammaproteobacteria bacterium]
MMLANKNIVVVLGMARSGTSAIASGVNAIGVNFGKHLEKPNALWNPKGFWEDLDIVFKINRGVLYALRQDWFEVHQFEESWQQHESLANLKKSAKDILIDRFTDTDYFGFKDPRTAMTLPFWQDIFSQLALNESYVISLRNPLASAYSYQRVSGADLEVGLLMWIMHLMPAITHTHGKKRLMVNYDTLLAKPREELMRIKQKLALPDFASHHIDHYVEGFLDKKLQHFEYGLADLKSHAAAAIVPICYQMYDLFLKLARDDIAFESDAFKESWFGEIEPAFQAAKPAFRYINVLMKRHKAQERALRAIHKSIPWKLIYPLRIVDDWLRDRRREKREKRRLVRS